MHNQSATSSDLGLRVFQIKAGRITAPVSVTVNVGEAGLPPAVQPDIFTEASLSASFDTAFPPQVLMTGGSVYRNDNLFSAAGTPYDPILEVELGGNPISPVTLEPASGHFSLMVPIEFFGVTAFTYRLRDKDGWSASALVEFKIAPSRPFDVWRQSNFGGGAVNPISLPEMDADGDGTPNQLEYIFGTNPGLSSPPPGLELLWNGTAWQLSFKAVSGFGAGAFLGVESSASLLPGSWKTLASLNNYHTNRSILAPGILKTEEQQGEWWQCRLTLPEAPGPYFRLRGSSQPLPITP